LQDEGWWCSPIPGYEGRLYYYYLHVIFSDIDFYRIKLQLLTFAIMQSSALGLKQSKTLKVQLRLRRAGQFSQRSPSKGKNLLMLLIVRIPILNFG
jgi:hypothetical protein